MGVLGLWEFGGENLARLIAPPAPPKTADLLMGSVRVFWDAGQEPGRRPGTSSRPIEGA